MELLFMPEAWGYFCVFFVIFMIGQQSGTITWAAKIILPKKNESSKKRRKFADSC